MACIWQRETGMRGRRADPANFEMLDRETLGDQVYAQLSELLVSGRLAPGDQLSLRAVAANLGVSIMPVRAAVNRLTSDGALEVTPNRAVRVPPMSEERFCDLTRIRIEVEGFAAAEAATWRTPVQLKAIARAEADFATEVAKSNPDPASIVSLNKEYHFAIYAAAGSVVLTDIIRGLWLKAGPIINLDFRSSTDRLADGGVLRRHARALKALETRDAENARDAIRDDIQNAADFILSKHADAQSGA
jgi:DNA-binding GntR family transcriptional regulator